MHVRARSGGGGGQGWHEVCRTGSPEGIELEGSVQVGGVHSGAKTTVPIDRGEVYLSHLTQALHDHVQEKLLTCLASLGIEVNPDTGTVCFADFLAAVYHLGVGSIISQVVEQVASFIERLADDKGFTSNAMQVEEDEASLPKHARHDRGLIDQLAAAMAAGCLHTGFPCCDAGW